MNNATTVSFSATMKLLTVADSLIPTTSTNDMIATIAMAGRFTIDPVELRPGVTQPATALATSDASHHRNGAEVRAAGKWMLTFSSRPTKYPDQPMPSVVRLSAPRVFLSVPSPVASASARRRAIDLVAHKLMRTSYAWEVGDGRRR